jgi:hypothetical protein
MGFLMYNCAMIGVGGLIGMKYARSRRISMYFITTDVEQLMGISGKKSLRIDCLLIANKIWGFLSEKKEM